MTRRVALSASFPFFALVTSLAIVCQEPAESVSVAPKAEAMDEEFLPVDDMHHFMEHVCQPRYQALRTALAEPPAERRAWRIIRSDAMTLAETSAIVAGRPPEGASPEQVEEWRKHSVAVYESGKALYGVAGEYEQSKELFGAMVDNCNRCHEAFENGRHILEK